MNKKTDEVRQRYELETGNKWMTNPVCHGELGFASWEYQTWLENKCAAESPLLAEIERLKEDLNNATNNNWGAWKIERAEVKGRLLATELRNIELQSNLSTAEKEKAELIERLRGLKKYDENDVMHMLDKIHPCVYVKQSDIEKVLESK